MWSIQWCTEVRTTMSENDRSDKIRATVLAKLHREGFYEPRGVSVDVAATFGIASHNRGQAKDEIADMADSDEYPVVWKRVGQAVMLEQDSGSWVASSIRRHGGDDALPWDLKGE